MQNQPLDSNTRYRAMFCHLLGLAWMPMMLVLFLIPVSNGKQGDWVFALFFVFVMMPLIGMGLATALVWAAWQASKNIHDFVNTSGREITNFMLANSFYLFICVTLSAMTCGIIPLGKLMGDFMSSFLPYLLILEPIILILHFLCIFVGATQTAKGRIYRYPLSIQFLRKPNGLD